MRRGFRASKFWGTAYRHRERSTESDQIRHGNPSREGAFMIHASPAFQGAGHQCIKILGCLHMPTRYDTAAKFCKVIELRGKILPSPPRLRTASQTIKHFFVSRMLTRDMFAVANLVRASPVFYAQLRCYRR